jgi:N-acetylglucosaminyldiphosphoundecaprenol N-acetyl-beta-D-mannosaminyltransferase
MAVDRAGANQSPDPTRRSVEQEPVLAREHAEARVNVIGTEISAINIPMALSIIDDWIARRDRKFICVRDAHGVVASRRDRALRAAHRRAGLVTPDGMPLVWLCRLAGFKHVDRVYGPDLLLALCEHSVARGYRHFFYGGGAGIAEELAALLQQRFPSLVVAGTYSPPFRELKNEEATEIGRLINDSRADIVWVGLSTPKQEIWMAQHRDKLTAPVLIGVGAAFDFHSGRKRQAPYWIQRSGFEWLFRVAVEPRRLLRRYAVTVPEFMFLVALQKLGLRRFAVDVE